MRYLGTRSIRLFILCAAALSAGCLLAACGPLTSPTAALPSLAPTATVPPATATGKPLPSPTWAPPTALPPWPTAGPTPTLAPALRPGMQTAVYFFFWHDCPNASCNPNLIYALPQGWKTPYAGDPDPRDGTGYSSLNRYWYDQELGDIRLAGVDVVLPVSWGDSPLPWFRTAALGELVAANAMLDSPLRIGLFDDTTSEVSEYNDFLDNQEFDGSAYIYRGAPLALSEPMAGFFFYDRKIKPFFQTIPRAMWATHDGRPVEAGGRPLIVVYTTYGITRLEYAGQLWAGIKAAFARDFQDGSGNPITPFVILETSWFTVEARDGSPSIDAVADGRYAWGTALLGPAWHTQAGYTTSSIGVGFDDLKNANSTNRVRRRDLAVDERPGGPGAFIEDSFARIPADTDLLLVETWNELYEGTNVCRAAYPQIAGRYVPEDSYIGLLRRLLRGQDLWWGAQPLPPSWPANLESGQTYRLDFPVRNTGTRTWTAEGGVYLSVQGPLFPAAYQARPEEPVRPGDVAYFAIPLTAPAQNDTYQVAWQIVTPDGPLEPAVSWALPVQGGTVAATLRVSASPVTPTAGQLVTLTVELDPLAQVVGARLRLRFDSTHLSLDGVWPARWQVEVDNDRGEAVLELPTDAAEPLTRLVQLRWYTRTTGRSGFWIEQPEVRLSDGTLLAPAPLWVPLSIAAAP